MNTALDTNTNPISTHFTNDQETENTNTNTASSTTDMHITTDKNAKLAATVFCPASRPKAAVMIAPATGIKRQFYHGFAQYLAEHGYGVITFDNEGIGESLQRSIQKSDASLISWGRHDMTAALEQLKAQFPDTTYHLVGHSAGGQLFGLMPNHQDLSSVFNYACSSGRIKNMPMPYRAKAMWFMDAYMPMSNLLFGYARNDVVGMGEPLPKLVAKQWSQWCNGQGYVKTAFGKTIHTHYYDDIRCPSLWLNAPDDDIANDANVADMLSVFPNMPAQTRTLTPSEYGLKEIGHMKFFSRKSQVLWQQAVDWLDTHSV